MDNQTILKRYGFQRAVIGNHRDHGHQLWESPNFLLKDYGSCRQKRLCRYLLEPKNLPTDSAVTGYASQSLSHLLKNNCDS
jgi:hypothetical protein